jgi:hypothetical protein
VALNLLEDAGSVLERGRLVCQTTEITGGLKIEDSAELASPLPEGGVAVAIAVPFLPRGPPGGCRERVACSVREVDAPRRAQRI